MKLSLRFCSILLILLYLVLPLKGHAAGGLSLTGFDPAVSASSDVPCDQCPCGDERENDCCGAAVCGCAFHSPPEQVTLLRYNPDSETLAYSDPSWSLPQVYPSIDVPPQNSFIRDLAIV